MSVLDQLRERLPGGDLLARTFGGRFHSIDAQSIPIVTAPATNNTNGVFVSLGNGVGNPSTAIVNDTGVCTLTCAAADNDEAIIGSEGGLGQITATSELWYYLNFGVTVLVGDLSGVYVAGGIVGQTADRTIFEATSDGSINDEIHGVLFHFVRANPVASVILEARRVAVFNNTTLALATAIVEAPVNTVNVELAIHVVRNETAFLSINGEEITLDISGTFATDSTQMPRLVLGVQAEGATIPVLNFTHILGGAMATIRDAPRTLGTKQPSHAT